MTVKEVMDVVYADRNYFESSGGGITLNGGEVMVQWKFALAILKECKKTGSIPAWKLPCFVIRSIWMQFILM